MNEHPVTIAMMIWLLFTLPAWVSFSVVCAYFGLIKSRTVTHFGIRSGWIARVYGVFYLFIVVAASLAFVYFSRFIKLLTYQKLSEALLYPFKFPVEFSLVFLVMSVIMWLISKWAERRMQSLPLEKIPSPYMIKKYRFRVLAVAGMVFLFGLLSMTGWPIALTLLLLLIYTYGETFHENNILKTGQLI